MATISEVLDPKGDVILLLALPHPAPEDTESESSPKDEEEAVSTIPEDEPTAAEEDPPEEGEVHLIREDDTPTVVEAAERTLDFYTPLPESEPEPIEETPDWPTSEAPAAEEPPYQPAPGPEYAVEPSSEYPEPYDENGDAPPPIESESPSSPPAAEPTTPERPGYRVLVSSSILRLASPHLATAIEDAIKDRRHLTPDDDAPLELDLAALADPTACLTLLHIFHHRTSLVPRAVSLGELTQLARLVDAWACREAVELFGDDWIRNLQHTLPKEADADAAAAAAAADDDDDDDDDDVGRWMCVAWVFGREREYRIATRVAQRCAREPLECYGGDGGYPVPRDEIDRINRTRHRALAAILTALNDALSVHQTSSRCSDACDSIVLGALTRRLHARGILDAVRDAPGGSETFPLFRGSPDDFSVRGLAAWVRDLELPSVHMFGGGGGGGGDVDVEDILLAPPPPLGGEGPPPPVEEGERLPSPAVGVPGSSVDEEEEEEDGRRRWPQSPSPSLSPVPVERDWPDMWGASAVKRDRRGRKKKKGGMNVFNGKAPPPPPAPEMWGGEGVACDPLAETKARVAEIAAGLRGLDIEA